VALLVGCLPSKGKILCSNPSIKKKRKKKKKHIFYDLVSLFSLFILVLGIEPST
jgi:hypothetical protein